MNEIMGTSATDAGPAYSTPFPAPDLVVATTSGDYFDRYMDARRALRRAQRAMREAQDAASTANAAAGAAEAAVQAAAKEAMDDWALFQALIDLELGAEPDAP